jgi:hypothetical protein
MKKLKLNLNYNVRLLGKETDINAGQLLAEEMMMITGLNGNTSKTIAELAVKIHSSTEGFELTNNEAIQLKELSSSLVKLPVFVKVDLCNTIDIFLSNDERNNSEVSRGSEG